MKPTPREYLTIFIALMAILACGIGVGYLIGKRDGKREARANMPDPGETLPKGAWQKRTLDRLTEQLELTDDQQMLVGTEIQRTSGDIKASRSQALEDYYRHLLALHERILPHLEPGQRAKIEEDKKKLQQTIDSRFQSP